MRLPLQPGAKFPRAKIYRQAPDSERFSDDVHDALHAEGKVSWAKTNVPGALPVFAVWKWVPQDKEAVKPVKLDATPDATPVKPALKRVGRVVIDCRARNKILEPDHYPLPTQDEILLLTHGKRFISIFDAAKFFHQWRVHPDDVRHQAIVSHRGQELLHVVVMGNANSVAYVQRQIDLILRLFRDWCRTYVFIDASTSTCLA